MAIVTLTSDFGTVDGFVGAMKGVILARAPGVTLVDVTHEVPRHDVVAGAHALASAVPWFPPGTIHLAVVDPGVGGARQAVAIDVGAAVLVGPDNGLFELCGAREGRAYALAADRLGAPPPSATFHGRDLFAVAAAALASGRAPAGLGPAVALRGALPPLPPPGPHGGHVVHVDRFGNLVSDVVAEAATVAVRVGGHTVALVGTYADVAPGELCACVGSRGTIEVAIREGDAAAVLGLGRGAVIERVAR